jgi:hypothetical protein
VYQIFFERMQMSRAASFSATCVAAFSFGVWFYSSNIEVYMPSLFFLLYGLYVCTKQQWSRRDVWKITAIHCLAVLFHQANVLFAVVVLWKFWDSRRSVPFWPSLLRYGIVSVVLVGSVYFIIGWWVEGNTNPTAFNTWLRGDTVHSSYWFPLSLGTFFHAMVGLGHAFFGGHFVFRIPFSQGIMNRVFYYHNLDDEAFLVRNLSRGMATVLLILTLLVCGVMLVCLVRILRHWKTLYRGYKRVMMPLLLFLAAYSVFFYFWMPDNLEFWIPQTVVIWLFLLGMSSLVPGKGGSARAYLGIALLLFIINYWGSIYWMKDINNDIVYVKTKKLKENAGAADVILLQDPWLISYFLEHYTKSTILEVPVEPAEIAQVNHKVDSCLGAGGKVYLFTEGATVHAKDNKRYADSLMSAHSGRVSDLGNALTPVKVIVNQ